MPHTVQAGKRPHKQSGTERKANDSHDQLAEAAYCRAAHRGFKGGDPAADWLAAEAEIKAAPNKGKASSTH